MSGAAEGFPIRKKDGAPTAQVKALAREMVAVFEPQESHREALAALRLYREAAEKEAVTVELIRRLIDYLQRARRNPHLRFEAAGDRQQSSSRRWRRRQFLLGWWLLPCRMLQL